MCYKDHTTLVNPIIDWTTEEVWEFLKEYNIPYCSLYDEGFKRLGCIGCPMASKTMREYEFERWPKYKNLYMIAFQKMIENRGGWQTLSDSRRSDEWLHDGTLGCVGQERPRIEYMTPEQLMEWWID